MNAIHILSTAPARARGRDYRAEDFDMYCTALSALTWRRYNGGIALCTDSAGAAFCEKAGITALWDEVRVCVADDLEGIDPEMFWAGGKLLALRDTSAPVVMLDTDFIVWKRLEFGSGVIAAHREELSEEVYPPLSYFSAHGHIIPDFDESALPLNTAFLYLPNDDLREFYTAQAIAFMKSAKRCGETLRYMVFAEQRMAAMCAEYTGTPVETLLDHRSLFYPQDDFTHLWGAKQQMRERPELRAELVGNCRRRLLRDFPEYSYIVEAIDRYCEYK